MNNPPLGQTILGYLAKYIKRYSVKLYAMAIEGNHLHNLCEYPEAIDADRLGVRRSIVARVAAVGGTAAVRSAPGEGTEVRLILPLDAAAARAVEARNR